MASKRKPKFQVGQRIWSSSDNANGTVEAAEWHDEWFYVVSCCAHARTEDELEPAREKGEARPVPRPTRAEVKQTLADDDFWGA